MRKVRDRAPKVRQERGGAPDRDAGGKSRQPWPDGITAPPRDHESKHRSEAHTKPKCETSETRARVPLVETFCILRAPQEFPGKDRCRRTNHERKQCLPGPA